MQHMGTNWILIAKVLAGEAAQEEIMILDQWSHKKKKNKQI